MGGALACDDINLPFVGVVNLDILWMSSSKDNVPVEYTYNDVSWSCSDPFIDFENCSFPKPSDPKQCWLEFQNLIGGPGFEFEDPNEDGLPEINTIYFAPNCQYRAPSGGTGSNNFGVMAAVPVLVE